MLLPRLVDGVEFESSALYMDIMRMRRPETRKRKPESQDWSRDRPHVKDQTITNGRGPRKDEAFDRDGNLLLASRGLPSPKKLVSREQSFVVVGATFGVDGLLPHRARLRLESQHEIAPTAQRRSLWQTDMDRLVGPRRLRHPWLPRKTTEVSP